jgi:hypothetical protein
MLRRLYRCVLGLHPPGFRERFGEEMLSIFDHAVGKGTAFRLLLDALLSLGKQWTLRPEFWREIVIEGTQQPHGIPSFHSLDPFRPRAAAIIHGLVLSMAVFSLTCFAIKYSWIHILHVRIPEIRFESPPSAQPAARDVANLASGKSAVPPDRKNGPVAPPSKSRPSSSAPKRAASAPTSDQSAAVQASAIPNSRLQHGSDAPPGPQSQDAAGTTIPAAVEDAKLDAAMRHLVIEGAIANVRKYYVDPGVAQKTANALLAYEQRGDDDVTDGELFADLLTRQMKEASHDPHLVMIYSAVKTAEAPPAPTPQEVAGYRNEMKLSNCTFERVEILPHNIGYVKFNAFPDASICGPRAAAAMAKLNHADAIIFDLRDNPGGYSNMVALIATYLFDHPTHLNDFYNRVENSTKESWTLPPVPGNRLADKPAFVLTSHSTFSAAEGFSYDLKMLKRATLVGETTSGRGHMGMEYRINDHFTIRVPAIRVVNPISKTNWEGTGVEPDVKVKAADALETAEKLAETELQKK